MDTILSLFREQKTIEIFSYNIPFGTFMMVALPILFISLFFVMYMVFSEYTMRQRIKDRNIKVLNKNTKKYFIPKIILRRFDREQMELTFLHSGNTMGINSLEMYFIYKVIYSIGGLLIGLRLFNPIKLNQSIVVLAILSIGGFFFTDILIKQAKKKRVKNIQNQLPSFLMGLDNYNKAGLLFEDILEIVPKTITGYLQHEVVRFYISYSLSKDFEGAVKEFVRRLGCSEAEEIEIKLRQCYYSGIYDDILTNEKELIEKKVISDIKKEAEMFNLYLGVAMALMIFNIFILVILPLMNMASSGMNGAMTM